MNILITGAKGFIGKNLVSQLNNIREGKAGFDGLGADLLILEYDVDTDPVMLDSFCAKADFVFHLAGVNRPKDQAEFMQGNFGFTSVLLDTLKKHKNSCPIMLSSSIQAEKDNPYGQSKKAGEDLLLRYGRETGAKTLVYRFPNVFGKWCRPNYNSAVATFCHNIANDMSITVNDRETQLQLVYIDDVVEEMLRGLAGRETREGAYCAVSAVYKATLGEIVDLLESFRDQPKTLVMPEIAKDSFTKKLYSTYLSYLPAAKMAFSLRMNADARGSFTELLKTEKCGQVSVNISKPGITKGNHWHHSKWEFFIVVAGHGLIQQRKIDTNEVLDFRVSGDRMEAVHMLPGYTHNIINLNETENLVTVMWANEAFDAHHPDTFGEPVEKNE